MAEELEIDASEMLEDTREEIINKIEAYSWEIRSNWSNPRSQCRSIIRLLEKLRNL